MKSSKASLPAPIEISDTYVPTQSRKYYYCLI